MTDLQPCPFCGGKMTRCDDSPIYGQSAMHDDTKCVFKNNLIYHADLVTLWNTRVLPTETVETLQFLYDAYYLSTEPMTEDALEIKRWFEGIVNVSPD